MFRSELMRYYQIILPQELAWESLCELGEIGCIQFVDQDPSLAHFSRPFAHQVKRCDDLQQKLSYIQNQMVSFQKSPLDFDEIPSFLAELKAYLLNRRISNKSHFEEIESQIVENYESLQQQIQIFEGLKSKYNYILNFKHVINHACTILNAKKDERQDQESFLQEGSLLNLIIGTVSSEHLLRFQRMIFRATRGNIFQSHHEIPKSSSELVKNNGKHSFVIVYQTGHNDSIRSKITKICDSFQCMVYKPPVSLGEYQTQQSELDAEAFQINNTIELTQQTIEEKLQQFQSQKFSNLKMSYITYIQLYLQKETAIYETLNLLKHNSKTYFGFAWVPDTKRELLLETLLNLRRRNPNSESAELHEVSDHHEVPPTYFELNAFTASFQQIVNTYGIPRYQEVNPGIFTIIMFPFLFGVMFGDIMHGGILFAFGIYLVKNYQSLKIQKGHMLEVFLPIRFLFILMGFFAFYAGFIYNDFGSMPFNLFGSCYERIEGSIHTEREEGCVYPLGIDPKWYIAHNELNYFNSLKMKMSVIIGVIQMSFGICMKAVNSFHFKQPLDFFFEFLPQIIFLQVTFGYMCIMIFLKWATNWQEVGLEKAPSIIGLLINMPLAGGSTKGQPLFDEETQESMQRLFLVIALVMVPLMLFPKPLILLWQHNKEQSRKQGLNEGLIEKPKPTAGGHGHGEFEFSEIFVHQIIETIEFVLGSISNTASYLRLWALSLAHSQLAKVFFEKTLGGGIASGNIIAIFIGWPVFLHITFGVLMCMDLMECFLHALRLQWVEFQNKFFKADGYIFQPLSFKDGLSIADTKK